MTGASAATHDPAARLAALYARAPLITRGVVHVVAAVRHTGRLHVLAIGAHAPKSETDFFVLSSTRARADVLITSARILRSEPDLAHKLSPELAAYRVSLGKDPLACAILTRDGDIPAEHGVFDDGTDKLVLTSPNAVGRVEERVRGRAEVIGIPDLDLPAAIRLLHARGHALVSIEAGPSTVSPLYTPSSGIRVDELLLTTFEGTLPDARGLGPALPADEDLLALHTLRAQSFVNEPSGPFRFACYQLRTSGAV